MYESEKNGLVGVLFLDHSKTGHVRFSDPHSTLFELLVSLTALYVHFSIDNGSVFVITHHGVVTLFLEVYQFIFIFGTRPVLSLVIIYSTWKFEMKKYSCCQYTF